MSERSSNPKRTSGSTPYRGYDRSLIESSKEFGTTYMDMLRVVVPTGTGFAVLPTVSGMQAPSEAIARQAAIRGIRCRVILFPVGFGGNLARPFPNVFT